MLQGFGCSVDAGMDGEAEELVDQAMWQADTTYRGEEIAAIDVFCLFQRQIFDIQVGVAAPADAPFCFAAGVCCRISVGIAALMAVEPDQPFLD